MLSPPPKLLLYYPPPYSNHNNISFFIFIWPNNIIIIITIQKLKIKIKEPFYFIFFILWIVVRTPMVACIDMAFSADMTAALSPRTSVSSSPLPHWAWAWAWALSFGGREEDSVDTSTWSSALNFPTLFP